MDPEWLYIYNVVPSYSQQYETNMLGGQVVDPSLTGRPFGSSWSSARKVHNSPLHERESGGNTSEVVASMSFEHVSDGSCYVATDM